MTTTEKLTESLAIERELRQSLEAIKKQLAEDKANFILEKYRVQTMTAKTRFRITVEEITE